MSQGVFWDSATRQPIVGGQIEDPETGELRAAGHNQYPGPPHIKFILNDVARLENLISGVLSGTIDSTIQMIQKAWAKFPTLQVVDFTATEYFIHLSYTNTGPSISIGDVWEVLAGRGGTIENSELSGNQNTSDITTVEINWLNMYSEEFYKLRYSAHLGNMNDVIFGLRNLVDNLGETIEENHPHFHSICLMKERLSVVWGTRMTVDQLRAAIDRWGTVTGLEQEES